MQDDNKPETYESAVFPPHMTPLMLACINENYDMVKMLLARGHQLKIVAVKECELASAILYCSLKSLT